MFRQHTRTSVAGEPATLDRPAPVGAPPLCLEERLYAEIIERLLETRPIEGCGLIAFDGGRPVRIYPGTNILQSPTRYRMADIEVLRAVDDMDRQGWWLGAIYHSHPNSPAVPSTTDLREANWPDAMMVIVSFMSGVPDLRAWRIVAQGAEEVPIEVVPGRARWLESLRWPTFRRTLGSAGRKEGCRPVWQPVGQVGAAGATAGPDEIGSPVMALPREIEAGRDAGDEPERRAVIGILGGMGPLATADLYRKIIEMTPAATDQDHIPVVIHADPRVPDRTEALLRGGDDPTPWLAAGARQLAEMGADFIVMPCNTAHAFLDGVQPAINQPILSMIDAAADEIRATRPEARVVGLLATSGTIAAEIYQQALLRRGLDAIVPDDDIQRRCVMTAIREVKSGRAGAPATALLVEAGEHLAERGADVLLEACTEIPIALQQRHIATPIVDATAALARVAVTTALHLDEAARDGDPQWETSTSGWGIGARTTGA